MGKETAQCEETGGQPLREETNREKKKDGHGGKACKFREEKHKQRG